MNTAMRASICLAGLLLSSCSWIVDEAAGFPASHVISGVKETSSEIKEEKHNERVEELNREYEEFLRSRDAPPGNQAEKEQSIVIKQNDDEN